MYDEFGFDVDVAAGYQDADIAMVEMAALANEREMVEAIVEQERESAIVKSIKREEQEALRRSGIHPDGCDHCGERRPLFHNEVTSLSLCEDCDIATEQPVKFKRLKNRAWGITGPSAVIEAGGRVIVTKRDGSTTLVTVSRVLWSGDGKAIATIAR